MKNRSQKYLYKNTPPPPPPGFLNTFYNYNLVQNVVLLRIYAALLTQTAVTVYFLRKQLLLFARRQNRVQHSEQATMIYLDTPSGACSPIFPIYRPATAKHHDTQPSNTKYLYNICTMWTNVNDVGPTLYKCYTHVWCLLGSQLT